MTGRRRGKTLKYRNRSGHLSQICVICDRWLDLIKVLVLFRTRLCGVPDPLCKYTVYSPLFVCFYTLDPALRRPAACSRRATGLPYRRPRRYCSFVPAPWRRIHLPASASFAMLSRLTSSEEWT